MTDISRRSVLAATAAGGLAMAATAVQAQTGQAMPMPSRPGVGGTDPGPRDALRDQQNPDIYAPPATERHSAKSALLIFRCPHAARAGWLDASSDRPRTRRFKEYRGREYAPECRRRARTALAQSCGMVLHALRQCAHHGNRCARSEFR